MNFVIQATKQTRSNCLSIVKDLSTEQLHFIPDGYNNNLIWHIGHMFVSEQILCYSRSNTPLVIPESYLPLYRKGSSPREWTAKANINELIHYMHITSEALESDYINKRFGTFNEYPTSSGIVLKSIEDAIIYSYGHENLHYGNIISMLKLIK